MAGQSLRRRRQRGSRRQDSRGGAHPRHRRRTSRPTPSPRHRRDRALVRTRQHPQRTRIHQRQRRRDRPATHQPLVRATRRSCQRRHRPARTPAHRNLTVASGRYPHHRRRGMGWALITGNHVEVVRLGYPTTNRGLREPRATHLPPCLPPSAEHGISLGTQDNENPPGNRYHGATKVPGGQGVAGSNPVSPTAKTPLG